MSIQTVNISVNDVIEHLNIKMASGWTQSADTEIDTLCLDHQNHALGYIVTLNINNGVYSFTVHEFHEAKQAERDYEETNDFATYDEALGQIRSRVDAFMNPMDYLADNF